VGKPNEEKGLSNRRGKTSVMGRRGLVLRGTHGLNYMEQKTYYPYVEFIWTAIAQLV
jgi:hypothetical protein